MSNGRNDSIEGNIQQRTSLSKKDRKEEWRRLKSNPELYKQYLESKRNYYQQNKEKRRKYARDFYAKQRTNPKIRKDKSESSSKSQKRRRIELRNQFIEFKGGKCERCGITDERVFEIHHINGREKWEQSRITTLTKVDWKELQLICANCHKIIHSDK